MLVSSSEGTSPKTKRRRCKKGVAKEESKKQTGVSAKAETARTEVEKGRKIQTTYMHLVI